MGPRGREVQLAQRTLCGRSTSQQYRRSSDENRRAAHRRFYGSAWESQSQGRLSGVPSGNSVVIRQLRRIPMSIISCDMRYGRSDEQKHALSAGLLRVIGEATGESADNIFFVIREGRGINFVEHGQHLPEFVEGNANDKELIARLK